MKRKLTNRRDFVRKIISTVAISPFITSRNLAIGSFSDEISVVKPKPASQPVINPGKGWVLYSKPDQTPREALAIGSLGYSRYAWADVEPEEGQYNWEIIERDLDGWAKLGKQFAFRIMGANTSNNKKFWITPKYVFDAGAAYSRFEMKPLPDVPMAGVAGTFLLPVFDDPIYMQKVEKFTNAMAAHFDGNPNLAFIDIGSYGNWGEAHMFPMSKKEISPEKFQEHLTIYRKAFKKTQLEICYGQEIYHDVFIWAAKNGIGMRCDGIGANRDGREVLPCVGLEPAVFEFHGPYEYMAEVGWWYGKKDKYGRGFRLKDCVENGKPTWCGLQDRQKGLKLLADERPLVESLANRLGYHFVLKQIGIPTILKRNVSVTLESTWENQGVAPIFIPAGLWYALLDESGHLVDECAASDIKLSEWKSDQINKIRDNITFSKARPGSYSLAVGIKRLGYEKPTIKIAIETKTSDGWHILENIKVNE